MRILFATTLIPTAERSGGELVSLALIDALEHLGHHTMTAGFLRPGHEGAGDDTIVVDHRPIETAASGARAVLWLARGALRNLPYTSAKFFARRYGSIVRDMCAQGQVDAVIIDHMQMYWLRNYVPDRIPVVLVMHNAESDLYARGAARGRSPIRRLLYQREARLLRQIEGRAAASVDRIWVLNAADAEIFRPRVSGAPIFVLPVMPEWRSGCEHTHPSLDVALLATWTWEPNADALRWFFSEVYPRLPQSTSVGVAGPGAEWLRGRCPGVTYLGFVDDASVFLRSARVIAVPTRYGSGVETKMFTAIGTGRPIVATSVATRGLDDLPASVMVADDAVKFAHSIATQLTSSAARQESQTQAVAWWQKRRRAFLNVLGAEMSAMTPNTVRAPIGSAEFEVRERARGFA